MARIIKIKIKRKPLLSPPAQNDVPVSHQEPLLTANIDYSCKSAKRVPLHAKKCLVCKANITGRRGALKRHVERHAKLAEIEAANFKIEPVQVKEP
ncbi:hypothetical protein F66182_8123 [Fusarium sp. NRRL 66182]|nr:hypothetical protein F66182_8123 [Fusarium sp. NRRL 66182]